MRGGGVVVFLKKITWLSFGQKLCRSSIIQNTMKPVRSDHPYYMKGKS